MNRNQQERDYSPEELREERQYGVFWYSWLWTALRQLLLALCVLTVVAGVVMLELSCMSQPLRAALSM